MIHPTLVRLRRCDAALPLASLTKPFCEIPYKRQYLDKDPSAKQSPLVHFIDLNRRAQQQQALSNSQSFLLCQYRNFPFSSLNSLCHSLSTIYASRGSRGCKKENSSFRGIFSYSIKLAIIVLPAILMCLIY